MEGNTITTQLLFQYKQLGVEYGRVIGEFTATGVIPSFMERLESRGFKISNIYFVPTSQLSQKRAP
jgi:hypothetical protein